MILHTLAVGSLEAGCYIAADDQTKHAIVIDPGDEAERIAAVIDDEQLELKYIVDTHAHIDHIGANSALKERFPDAQLCVHAEDAAMLTKPSRNLSLFVGASFRSVPADRELIEGDEIAIGSLRLRVLHVPGHTPGGICLYAADAQPPVLFSGDALFAGGIGRSDFPGGDGQLLLDSIRTKLFTLPDQTIVYPGHGPETTVGREKRSNPFF